MTDIIPFDFETHAVRIVMIDDAPWFVASDVCRVLEHTNPTVALSRLDGDERRPLDPKLYLGSSGRGGAQSMSVVSESGLFALIFTSNKPAAKRFRKWVTAEVLPAIRRDGHYGLPSSEAEDLIEKRKYFEALPEEHQARALKAVGALEVLQEAIEGGASVRQAVEVAAEEIGISERTIWGYRRAVYMVPRSDWVAALAPKWRGQRAMCVDCHPDAMRRFLELGMSGARPSDCYRRWLELAEDNNWGPLPSEPVQNPIRLWG